MWNIQDQARKSGKEAGLEEEVRLKIKVSNEGNLPESMEDITDDEVFKELINIVVDVFSHKSEKCLLTFELPSQTNNLAAASSDSLRASVSDYGVNEPSSDISIPYKSCESIPSRKSSKHDRNIKLPINKPSKHSKKLFNKRLNPIVQTVLHAKQGFTDLETLFKLKDKSAYRGRRQKSPGNEGRLMETLGQQQVTRNEWIRLNEYIPNTWNNVIEEAEKRTLYTAGRAEGFGDSNNKSSLYHQLQEVIETVGVMMKICGEKPHTDSHKIESHITEIKAHITAIGGYLFGGSSNPSSSREMNNAAVYPVTEKVGTLISRTKKRRKDVTLYRIATNRSFRSRSRSRRRRRNRNYRSMKANKSKQVHSKKKNEGEMSLEGVLRSYQRVKREETELVKSLLYRLGLASMKTESPHRKQREHLDSTKARGHQTTEESFDLAHETILDSLITRRLNDSGKKMTQKVQQEIGIEELSAILEKPGKSLRSTRARQPLEMRGRRRTHRKRHTSKLSAENVARQSDANDSVQSCFPTQDIDKCNSDIYVQSLDDVPIVEDKVVSRIQNAAERLEHMQDLVEKKLGYLCKQKEFYQEMKTSLLNSAVDKNETKTDEAFKNKESNSSKEQSKESQNEEYEMPEATMKTYPSHVRYTNVNLEESKDFKELLKGFEEASSEERCSNFKDKKLKSEAPKKEMNSAGGRTYICNYMVEMRGCQMTDDQREDARQVEILSRVESNVVLLSEDDAGKEQIRGKDSFHEVEEVKREDGEGRETLVNMYKSSTQFEKHKAEQAPRKKNSRSNFPRKSWCILS
ncbi:hypothetical protein GE061_001788 [Apolygus lucorum]|uniref:Uncharacterized protein n=1 Tax=Apolygus lucorum TaxID=248454 RepID=A0A6A4J568_APOLU|nr:hypothetical protein GE061_001788 [Apolygus lucorum]